MIRHPISGKGTGIASDSGLYGGNLKYRQPDTGFRSAVDSLALMAFSDRVLESPPGTVLDTGCGSGFLMLTAGLLWPHSQALGIELSKKRHSFAVDNITANEMDHRLTLVQDDLREWVKHPHEPFDLIVANPPFFPLGQGTLPPDSDKAMARFELSFNLEDLMTLAERFLTDSGIMTCIYPFQRREELCVSAAKMNLELHREQWVLPKAERPPKYVLTAWRKIKCSDPPFEKSRCAPLIFEDEKGDLGPALKCFEMKLSERIT